MAPDDDWDLHAVVRGCSTASCSTTTPPMNFISTATTTTSSVFNQQQQQDDYFIRMQDLYTRNGGDAVDLFDLYKPFYRKISSSPPPPPQSSTTPLSPQSIIPALSSSSSLSVYGLIQQENQNQIFKQNFNNNINNLSSSLVGPCTSTTTPTNKASNGSSSSSYLTQKCSSRSKRRKNQMKKVIEIPADALASDMWSWRKYGQKPIKGSPYPRGYYRCSTSKGCLARKQVERNRSDPGMFTVTYTAEHNHPMPTHRNSLAGSSRQKPSGSGSGSGSPPVSPSSVCLSVEPEKFEIESCKDEILEDEMIEDGDENISKANNVNLEDDFFDGLEEIAAINSAGISNSFSQSIQFPWLTNKATTTTAAGGI